MTKPTKAVSVYKEQMQGRLKAHNIANNKFDAQ